MRGTDDLVPRFVTSLQLYTSTIYIFVHNRVIRIKQILVGGCTEKLIRNTEILHLNSLQRHQLSLFFLFFFKFHKYIQENKTYTQMKSFEGNINLTLALQVYAHIYIS